VIDDTLEEEYAEMVELIYEKIVGEIFFLDSTVCGNDYSIHTR
jgi:hypothetical protein